MKQLPFLRHLISSEDLETTYEATRAGFVALALEKNRRATPFVAEARALYEAASWAEKPADLIRIPNIEHGLLTAAGLSEKALVHLLPGDKVEAINRLVERYLEPAGDKFVEELVFRFLLIRGDALGGSMRNIGGMMAQRKLTRAILSSLNIAGVKYRWQHAKTRKWIGLSNDDSEIELCLRGINWQNNRGDRTLIFNLNVPLVKTNADLCLLSATPEQFRKPGYLSPETYLAFGELKGGIDPAGADEHWKTAKTSLERIRQAFIALGHFPATFFIGAAIEKRMAGEIWSELADNVLTNAANLNQENQIASISSWLCSI